MSVFLSWVSLWGGFVAASIVVAVLLVVMAAIGEWRDQRALARKRRAR